MNLATILVHRRSTEGRFVIKAGLARVVYETHGGISYREAQELVETMLQSMKNSLSRGENVKLSGFGTLRVIARRERTGRNPHTGARIGLKPSKYVTFRISRSVQF